MEPSSKITLDLAGTQWITLAVFLNKCLSGGININLETSGRSADDRKGSITLEGPANLVQSAVQKFLKMNNMI